LRADKIGPQNNFKNMRESNKEKVETKVCEFNGDVKLNKIVSGVTANKYTVSWNAADFPRIVGSKGSRFRALRRFMELAGQKSGYFFSLKQIEEPKIGEPKQFPPFKYNPRWPRDQVVKLLQDLCDLVFIDDAKVTLHEGEKAAILLVQHSAREQINVTANIAEDFNSIFSGVGITNGCDLTVDVATL